MMTALAGRHELELPAVQTRPDSLNGAASGEIPGAAIFFLRGVCGFYGRAGPPAEAECSQRRFASCVVVDRISVIGHN